MLPLFDLMMKAQNGNAMEAMAKQFGLAQEQMNEAMAALMPAFSTGLKRTATNPYDFTNLMTAAASGNYSQYFEDMTKAFSPQGINDGNAILGQIFGSKDVSRAIADQAAQMSGIGQDIYKRMMPVVANAMVGGFFKQIADQFQAAGEAFASGKAPNFMEQWMQASGMTEKPKAPPQSMFDNPFMQSFQAMFTPPSGTAKDAAAAAFGNNPFMQAFQSMTTPPQAAPKVEKAGTASETGQMAMANMFSQMFDSGIEVQKNYQKSMDGIIERYFGGIAGSSNKTDSK